jgi:hypothetical protein
VFGDGVPVQQITFGRIRLVMNPIPFDGDDTVYQPYGVWTFPGLVAGDRLFFADDVASGARARLTARGPLLCMSRQK